MTRVAPTPALARLRGQFPSPTGVRVVYHRGHQDEAKAERVHDSLRQALGEILVEGTCDGACWAAPAATVQREAHQHRFALLEPVLPEALTQCVELAPLSLGLEVRLGDSALAMQLRCDAATWADQLIEIEARSFLLHFLQEALEEVVSRLVSCLGDEQIS